jgi:protein SCO1/2
MKSVRNLSLVALMVCVVSCREQKPGSLPTTNVGATNLQIFQAKGVIKELKPDGKTAVIQHEAISNYMAAMTMPFRVKAPKELAGLQPGDEVTFRLLVSSDAGWIDRVTKTGRQAGESAKPQPETAPPPQRVDVVAALSAYTFTNELGQPVKFSDFKGQAIGLTFFFTRCPFPEYCPRLMKNFAEASRQLKAMTNAPTNWHLLAISFDTEADTPAMLRAYAERYNYDPKHWSFLTGSSNTLSEVTQLCGFNYQREAGTYTHNFVTAVMDASGLYQAAWPMGGDTSGGLVAEILKACLATN